MKYKGIILLTLCAIIWGGAFVAQSAGMDYIGPFTFGAIRNTLGGLVLLPVIFIIDYFHKDEKNSWSNPNLWKGGVICGIALFIASSLQQVGIQYTTVGKAGFLTALYIILVPVISLLFGRKLSNRIIVSVIIALIGLYFLCLNESLSLGLGEILLLLCALSFSIQILAIDHYAPKADPVKLSSIEFLVTGLLSIIPMIFEHPEISSIQLSMTSILYAGIMSCGVAYTFQMIGQKDVEPTLASLIMSLEAVFSLIFGWIILHQSLSSREMIGCILMFTAIIIAQLPQKEESL